ncbi:MAG: cobalamin-dependent protein [Labilithrix sp.]|nr:cobalamin-dependent protein [Labilithrix sp.]
MRVLLVSANREQYPAPVMPLGVLSVAGAVRDAHEVRVLDLCFEDDPLRAAGEAASSFAPDVVGIGLRNLHDNAYGSSEPLLAYYEDVSRAVRAATRAPLVLGGAAITLQPATLLDRLEADHAVVGEGELAFRALVSGLERGERPPRVVRSAVAERRLVQLDAKLGLRVPPIPASELDALAPPARDLVDPRYLEVDGTESFQTKRGCAFQCAYCDYPDLEGRKVRMRDPERIADEIALRARVPGVSYAFIVDSVFNVPRAHALAVCEALERRGSPLPWVCYATPASLDDELVAAMRRAGCAGAELGTDTGTPRVLERLRKPFDLDDVRRVRQSFLRHGVADAHSFVLGAEGETVEEAEGTLAFVRELDPDVAVFVVFMEDREERTPGRAAHHQALLDLLAREAPKHSGWIVPELGIRFGEKVRRLVAGRRLRGPAWLHLAAARRRAGARLRS